MWRYAPRCPQPTVNDCRKKPYTSTMESLTKNQLLLGAGALIIIGIIGWFLFYGSSAPEPAATNETAIILPEEETLISDIGASADSATLKDSIPTVAPSTNPIKNIYKNPFE